jgi:hypothetical protein
MVQGCPLVWWMLYRLLDVTLLLFSCVLLVNSMSDKDSYKNGSVFLGCVRFLVRTGPDRYQKHSFIGTVGIRPFN